jgi:hypothetical protein
MWEVTFLTDNATLWYKINPEEELADAENSEKIEFNDSTIVMKSLTYTPDIKLKQTPNTNSGTRRSTLTDNGSGGVHIIIVLEIRSTETQAATNIFDFINISQVTDSLVHGVFSFTYPALPKFAIEAGATRGLGIGPQTNIKAKTSDKKGSYICEIHLYSGGVV